MFGLRLPLDGRIQPLRRCRRAASRPGQRKRGGAWCAGACVGSGPGAGHRGARSSMSPSSKKKGRLELKAEDGADGEVLCWRGGITSSALYVKISTISACPRSSRSSKLCMAIGGGRVRRQRQRLPSAGGGGGRRQSRCSCSPRGSSSAWAGKFEGST